MLGSHVANDDAGGLSATGWVRELGGINDPGIDAAGFKIAARGGLLGQDDARLHRLAGGEAAEQGVRQTGIKESFANRPVEQLAATEECARRFVGEADVSLGIDEQKRVAKGIQQAVAFIAGLLEIEFEAEFPSIDFCFRLFA